MYNFAKFCCLCLSDEREMQSINNSDRNGVTMEQKIRFCCVTDINLQDCAPNFICYKCVVQLWQSYDFITVSLKNLILLNKRLIAINETNKFTDNDTIDITIDDIQLCKKTTNDFKLPSRHTLKRLNRNVQKFQTTNSKIYKNSSILNNNITIESKRALKCAHSTPKRGNKPLGKTVFNTKDAKTVPENVRTNTDETPVRADIKTGAKNSTRKIPKITLKIDYSSSSDSSINFMAIKPEVALNGGVSLRNKSSRGKRFNRKLSLKSDDSSGDHLSENRAEINVNNNDDQFAREINSEIKSTYKVNKRKILNASISNDANSTNTTKIDSTSEKESTTVLINNEEIPAPTITIPNQDDTTENAVIPLINMSDMEESVSLTYKPTQNPKSDLNKVEIAPTDQEIFQTCIATPKIICGPKTKRKKITPKLEINYNSNADTSQSNPNMDQLNKDIPNLTTTIKSKRTYKSRTPKTKIKSALRLSPVENEPDSFLKTTIDFTEKPNRKRKSKCVTPKVQIDPKSNVDTVQNDQTSSNLTKTKRKPRITTKLQIQSDLNLSTVQICPEESLTDKVSLKRKRKSKIIRNTQIEPASTVETAQTRIETNLCFVNLSNLPETSKVKTPKVDSNINTVNNLTVNKERSC